jgi:hypothetical protein
MVSSRLFLACRVIADKCRRSNQHRPLRVELKPATFSLQICCAISALDGESDGDRQPHNKASVNRRPYGGVSLLTAIAPWLVSPVMKSALITSPVVALYARTL